MFIHDFILGQRAASSAVQTWATHLPLNDACIVALRYHGQVD